ncbi:9998_t:CDS:2, partial [Racocetra fulgida]
MQEMLFDPNKDIGQRLAALQLILTLTSSKTTNAFEFLKPNDILCAVLEWAPNPISLLKGASCTNDPITEKKLASRIVDILVFLLSFFKMRQTAEESINKLSIYDKPDVNSLYTNGTYDKITASTDAICDILFIPNYITDHRILESVLSVIPTALSAKIANSQTKE